MSDIDVRSIESTPELEELLQEEPTGMPVSPVEVRGPVQTFDLPSRYVQTTTVSGVTTTYEKIADATEKRKVIRLVSIDGPMWVKCGGLEGAIWPTGSPCVMTHTKEVMVRADTATVRIGVIQEFWAD